jgi:hypothetical protein
MQGRDATSRRDNWDKPAKGDNPDRKSQVLQVSGGWAQGSGGWAQGSGGWAQGQQPRLVKIGMLKHLNKEMKGW